MRVSSGKALAAYQHDYFAGTKEAKATRSTGASQRSTTPKGHACSLTARLGLLLRTAVVRGTVRLTFSLRCVALRRVALR